MWSTNTFSKKKCRTFSGKVRTTGRVGVGIRVRVRVRVRVWSKVLLFWAVFGIFRLIVLEAQSGPNQVPRFPYFLILCCGTVVPSQVALSQMEVWRQAEVAYVRNRTLEGQR